MNCIGRAVLTAAILAGSSQAQAADWWWVSGEPQDRAIQFVDADTVLRDNAHATVQVLSVERTGQSSAKVLRFRCDTPPDSPEIQPIRLFACGEADERVKIAAMLGPITPREAAQAIFASPATMPGLQADAR